MHFRDNYTSIVDALNKGRGDRFALLVIGVLIEVIMFILCAELHLGDVLIIMYHVKFI